MLNEKKCCIDSCVWIKYGGYYKVSTLFYFIRENKLKVYADNYLLSEVHEALLAEFNFTISEADKLINIISPYLFIKAPHNIY